MLSPPATQILFPHTLPCRSQCLLWIAPHGERQDPSSAPGHWAPAAAQDGSLGWNAWGAGTAVSREGGDKSPPCAVRLHSRSADPTCPAQDLLSWQEQEMLPHLGQAANAAESQQQLGCSISGGFNQQLCPDTAMPLRSTHSSLWWVDANSQKERVCTDRSVLKMRLDCSYLWR